MEEQLLSEWIDQYMMGRISPEKKAELERMMASDPVIAEQVKESQAAFRVLQLAHSRQLRDKLKALDKDDISRSGFTSKWMVMTILFIIVMVGSWYWAAQYYSNQAIAIRYFESSGNDVVILLSSETLKSDWEEANNAFMREEYDLAFNYYTSIVESDEPLVAYHARWNILLTDLVLHGQTVAWRKALVQFTNEAPPPINSRAKKLSALLHSSWYTVIARFTQTDISGLKPKLI